MTQWTDLFLRMPMPETWLHGLLFIAFGMHLLFVLLMLGTAALGLLFFMHTWMSGEAGPQVWSKQVIGTHLGLKSLAVVLGVAPLLIIQVRYSYAFFTATGLFSFAWLSVIPLLIAAFLLIDLLGHKLEARSWVAFIAGILGVGALLTVPAIFTGAISLMERQFLWPRLAEDGFSLGIGFLPHWGLRYLHILGAALAFGAAFHLFFSTEKHPEKAPLLRKWIFGAILAQAVIGVPLLFTVATHLNWSVIGAVSAGIIAASLVLWVLWPASPPRLGAGPRSLLVLLPLIFVSMLVTRQFLQDRFLAPGHAQEEARLRQHSDALAAYQPQALAAFTRKLKTVYDNGDTIYTGACQPCHGQNGHGDGPATSRLIIPAEDIAAIRADRGYIYGILQNGTPGSGMPYFRLYEREKLERLMDTLSQRFDMFAPPQKAPRRAGSESFSIWANTCSVCHGIDGAISPFGHTLLPAPPDLRAYSLTHERALEVIRNGYPGTVMPPFRAFPEPVLEELAAISNSFRTGR